MNDAKIGDKIVRTGYIQAMDGMTSLVNTTSDEMVSI